MKKIIMLAVAAFLGLFSIAFAAGELSKEQKSQMEEVIKEYLLKNPEIIRDALQELQKKEQEAQLAEKKKLIKGKMKELTELKDDPFIGKKDGKVTVVEFFDYNCPYCRRAKPVVAKLLEEDKRVRYVFKEFPILSETSRQAAEVALAVWKVSPDKYKDFHWGLMLANKRVDEALIKEQVAKLGMKWDEIVKVSKSDEIKNKIEANIKLAQELGIDGTPSFVVGEEFFPGLVPLEELKRAVNVVCSKPEVC